MTEIVLDRWRVGAPLGAGGFGRVYEATSGDHVAVVKFVRKLPGAERELLFADDLADATHIIPIIDSGEAETDWVLVMHKAETSLEDHLAAAGSRLDQVEAIEILIDVAMALESLHGRVVHRDLKPANILRYLGHWCLADFGISRYAEATTDPATRMFAMTPAYAAPEQWRYERATSATDVYALGIVAYRMLAGRLPFEGPDREDYRDQHLHGPIPPLSDLPPALAALVRACLYKAPATRPTPADILQRLRGMTLTTPSASIQRLQAASLAETERRAEQDRQRSAARSESEQRAALAQDASDSLSQISTALFGAIVDAAPEAQVQDSRSSWSITLGGAQLTLAASTRTPANPWGAWGRDVDSLDVVAHTSLALRFPPRGGGWEGRSHSLWFCNYASRDRTDYAWFEGAFMLAANLRTPQPDIVPFTLPPGEESAKALSRVMSEFQIARQFVRLTPGDLDAFVERWVGWFADAALGRPRRPDVLPER